MTSLFGLVTTANAVADNEHTISRTRVAIFFHRDYFPNAVARPGWTLTHLTTDDFQSLPVGDRKSYVAWWKQVETVPDSSINLGPATEEKNTFSLGWTWVMKHGRGSSPHVEVKVTCASFAERYVPFMSCSQENIRLDDSRRVTG